jgi:hypothetical protein
MVGLGKCEGRLVEDLLRGGCDEVEVHGPTASQ